MPKASRKNKTTDLSKLLKDGYNRLDAVRATCPDCGEEILASMMEQSAEEGEVFYLPCGAVDDEGEPCLFFATVAFKDGTWHLIACGFEEENGDIGESYMMEIDDEDIE